MQREDIEREDGPFEGEWGDIFKSLKEEEQKVTDPALITAVDIYVDPEVVERVPADNVVAKGETTTVALRNNEQRS